VELDSSSAESLDDFAFVPEGFTQNADRRLRARSLIRLGGVPKSTGVCRDTSFDSTRPIFEERAVGL
jgi:hypothetical protein